MGDYQPLRSDIETDTTVIHRRAGTSAAKQDLYYKKPWSPLRKIAFGSSLLLCFMTISVFLWVIPCEWSTCPKDVKQLGWDKTLYGLEIKGEMNVVKTRLGMYLIAMAQGTIWNNTVATQGQQFPPHGSGVICLSGLTGSVTWWMKLSSNPILLDCSIIDVNSDGVNDCLVLGEHGYLVAIDPESGMKKWKFGKNLGAGIVLEDMLFPVIIPDVNDDGVYDMVAITRLHGSLNNNKYLDGHYLVLICGKTGHMLGTPINKQSCSDMFDLNFDDDSLTISYTCKREKGYRQVLSLTLRYMVSEAMKKSLGPVMKVKLKQHEKSNEYRVGKHKLSVSRTGHCPETCSMSLNITLFSGVGHTEINKYSMQDNYTYVMNPVVINFDRSIIGFVLKFWQWPRHLYPHTLEKIDKTKLKLEKIYERVILVTFNETDEYSDVVKIVNASQTEIMQICGVEGCQPELKWQTDSMMIVDLDDDGSQELISYSVSYKRVKQNTPDWVSLSSLSKNWELQSKIRVVRLQSELSKLYESISH